MELRQLRHFLAVVECGSIGKAARRLGISQPAMTKYILALERRLGTPLFVRSSGGMALNQFGRALERRARTIVIQSERAQGEIRELAGGERGRVVIGTAPSFAASILLPHVLPAFRASHPHVEIVVIEGFFAETMPLIVTGEIDFACNTVPPRFDSDQVLSETLLPDEIVAPVVGAGNPIAAQRRVTLQELQSIPWAFARTGDTRARLNEVFLGHGLPPPEAAVVFNSVSFAKEALRHGPYVAMLSQTLVRAELAAGALRTVHAPELVLVRRIAAFYRADAALAPTARRLLDQIRAACRSAATHDDRADVALPAPSEPPRAH